MGDRSLRIAVGAAVTEVAVLIVALVVQGTLTGAPLRVVFLATKLPVAWLTLQRRPAAYLTLWVYEIAAVVGATRSDGPLAGRGLVGVAAIVVMVLLGRASSAFPPVEWKPR